MNEVTEVCELRFKESAERIAEIHDAQKEQARQLESLSVISAQLNERFDSLTHSMRMLTKALWGVALGAASFLLDFIVRYIRLG